MRKNAQKVLQAFAENKPKKGDSISTNGSEVFSYNMLIARTSPTGGVELLVYADAPSATTRSHIRAVEEFFSSRSIDSRFSNR